MSESRPMFSVVTCCYNQGPFLAACIESVLKQNYPQSRLIGEGIRDKEKAWWQLW